MRIFAVSDLHVDYDVNAAWVANLSTADYRDDVLILAGDVTDRLPLLDWCLRTLTLRFRTVLFVPGNHDLWVLRDRARHDGAGKTSLQKFDDVAAVVASCGASMSSFSSSALSIIPLFGWYDYSFGLPGKELMEMWMDYHTCRWPSGMGAREIAAHFLAMNAEQAPDGAGKIITFSHFMPRIDLMPATVPPEKQLLYPILGSTQLDRQLRKLRSTVHVYGHSHVNRRLQIDGVTYINNAFGYPQEERIASKRLVCIETV